MPISANSIASQLLKNGKFKCVNKDFTRRTSAEVIRLSKIPHHSPRLHLSGTIAREELLNAIAHLRNAKASGLDRTHPEFMKNQGKDAEEWLHQFVSLCLGSCKLPKIWHRSKVIALEKPNKPKDDPKNYCPTALLCIPFKIMEHILHTCLYPVIDPQLPKEQAVFCRGRSTKDQGTFLTQDIEDSFQAEGKAGAIVLNLMAAL